MNGLVHAVWGLIQLVAHPCVPLVWERWDRGKGKSGEAAGRRCGWVLVQGALYMFGIVAWFIGWV